MSVPPDRNGAKLSYASAGRIATPDLRGAGSRERKRPNGLARRAPRLKFTNGAVPAGPPLD
jgi:hypothetical protein